MSEPNHAQHLIIGVGIIGCSIAYHLTAMGAKDVVILEKADLTHGATWHAAGLVGQLRSSRNTTRMLKMSVELYDKLEEETGQAVDWKKSGSLRLASSPERDREVEQLATTAKSFGLEMEIISASEAQKLFPLMTTKGVLAAAYLPSDGQIDPSSVTQALAKGARDRGARIVRAQRVIDIISKGRRVTEVMTEDDSWTCETLINASGMWSRELGRLSNVRIPACALEHQYIITETIPDMPKDMPSMRDPDRLVYYKPEVSGMVIGGLAHGIGAALYEKFEYQPNGQFLSATFADYLMPSVYEIPMVKDVEHCTPSPLTSHGQKGSGEGGYLGAPAAIAGAVNDALQPLGITIDELPMRSHLIESFINDGTQDR